jgi:pimeloyl-ACP methyl ester carboxylesterase
MNKMTTLKIQTAEFIIERQKISAVFRITERKKPLSVFLHGWGSSGLSFNHLFADQPNFVAIDFPGSGKSSPLQKVFTLEDYTRITKIFLEKFFQNADLPESISMHLIGHSFGGRVIAKLLELYPNEFLPEKIAKIVFIAVPFYRDSNIKTQIIGKLFSIGKKIIPAFFQKNIKKIAHKIIGENDYFDLAENQIMKTTFQNIVGEEIAPYLQNLKKFSKGQIFCFWGENDEVIPLSFAHDLQKEISHLQIFAIPGAGHFPWIDFSGEKNKIFMKHWKNMFQ